MAKGLSEELSQALSQPRRPYLNPPYLHRSCHLCWPGSGTAFTSSHAATSAWPDHQYPHSGLPKLCSSVLSLMGTSTSQRHLLLTSQLPPTQVTSQHTPTTSLLPAGGDSKAPLPLASSQSGLPALLCCENKLQAAAFNSTFLVHVDTYDLTF